MRSRGLWIAVVLAAAAGCGGDAMEIITGDRSPSEVRRTGNRLRDATSLYLRQHAGNPVDWYPWGEEALECARREDRPIFLSSGYASCHWCHVMEHEVFEHDEVAEILNRSFVCIKVDREERPDIDGTYMHAVQLMTGGGGWPMSVFLTPDREPFFGGTYIPRDRFIGLLGRIDELWRTRRGDVVRQAGEVTQHVLAEPATAPSGAAGVDRALLAGVVERAGLRFDPRNGGFAGSTKFPTPVRWRFLLDWYRRTGDEAVRAMVEKTLDAMAGGGLRDHVGGGFHRYTVDAGWTVPHFEKMLYDNAQLARLFLEAGAALRRPNLTAVGVDVLAFLDREMCDEDGACYASFDADSGGEEGSYYVWTRAQVTAAVGEPDGPLLADLLGVTAGGNFERGASVVTQRADLGAIADRHGREPSDLADLFERHRETLRDVRSQRPAPGLDRKIITAWNGLALSAFARGHMATGRADFRERAERLAAYLDRVHRAPDGGVFRASNDGRPTGPGVLEDHALFARGLLDLYQISGSADHLGRATELLARIRERFARQGGAWYTSPVDAATPLGRRVDLFDSVIPAGASATVDVLVTCGALTGRTDLLDEARTQLAAQAGLLDRAGLEMAGWLDAALRLEGPIHDVVVVGDRGADATAELYRTAASGLSPGVVVTPLPRDGASRQLQDLAPALRGKTATDDSATAYVCLQGRCLAPTHDSAAVRDRLGEIWIY